jgi:hypothetical protein
MFKKLKDKWQVSWLNFTLIFCTFAIGGSICGRLAGKILGIIAIENRLLYFIVYIVVVTILWPFVVLLVSMPLQQFKFFKNYIAKIFKRFL